LRSHSPYASVREYWFDVCNSGDCFEIEQAQVIVSVRMFLSNGLVAKFRSFQNGLALKFLHAADASTPIHVMS
jgi:hypothetical protein